MILCFECAPEVKEQLDALMASGGYRDYGELISGAVSNLTLIQKEVAGNGGVVIQAATYHGIEQKSPPQVPVKESAVKTKRETTAKKSASTVKNPARRKAEKQVVKQNGKKEWELPEGTGVPGIFTMEEMPEKAPQKLADLPPDMWNPKSDVPLDRWVLGQYNRLLPAKVNARGLLWLYMQDKKPVELSEVASVLSSEAVRLGDYLTEIDNKLDIGRDNLFATAFPTSGEDEDKGRARFANQFVVYKNGKGELSGLMIALKLLSPVRGGRRVVPTTVAWEFAKLPNPVLDGEFQGEGVKFSDDERAFLIRHITASVPVEAFAYKSILSALHGGCNSPEKIDAALCASMPDDRAKELSKSYLASQRSGAISRMADLGLVEREREGVRVFYRATEAGLEFLQQGTADAVRSST